MAHPQAEGAADIGLDDYVAAMEQQGTPVLGHLVLYSILDGRVTRDDLERWFLQLGLDMAFVPPPLRPVDAFEKVTGPDGIKVSYPLDGKPLRRDRRDDAGRRYATLMVRHVRRDPDRIVRHLVREVRDEGQVELSYDTKLGECVFERDSNPGAGHGGGVLRAQPDRAAITTLSELDQTHISKFLGEISLHYSQHCTFLTGDRLRSLIRRYVEGLNAIRVRPTGGVYFVHHRHAETLSALRELVSRFGPGSHLARVPLPDQDEMREMITTAFTNKAANELKKLATDIAAAHRSGEASGATIENLYKRFRELKAATAEHSQLLSTSLGDTDSALHLVELQLGSLLDPTNG